MGETDNESHSLHVWLIMSQLLDLKLLDLLQKLFPVVPCQRKLRLMESFQASGPSLGLILFGWSFFHERVGIFQSLIFNSLSSLLSLDTNSTKDLSH